ncbi:hypothetical protein UK23_38280 [Lentzea aerocolonigenes]|uniref:Uncharacterized protein n=1 Tax=Lentzea aerocolonigenes TaxID=68170 RepID=A0A0F0GJT9_LENAE|nr:hypothetical protein [Lentzea aerocolonigenes]KJK42187.1 hypothetical protein UK23_38280 [Lentzea aerocolonigenes]
MPTTYGELTTCPVCMSTWDELAAEGVTAVVMHPGGACRIALCMTCLGWIFQQSLEPVEIGAGMGRLRAAPACPLCTCALERGHVVQQGFDAALWDEVFAADRAADYFLRDGEWHRVPDDPFIGVVAQAQPLDAAAFQQQVAEPGRFPELAGGTFEAMRRFNDDLLHARAARTAPEIAQCRALLRDDLTDLAQLFARYGQIVGTARQLAAVLAVADNVDWLYRMGGTLDHPVNGARARALVREYVVEVPPCNAGNAPGDMAQLLADVAESRDIVARQRQLVVDLATRLDADGGRPLTQDETATVTAARTRLNLVDEFLTSEVLPLVRWADRVDGLLQLFGLQVAALIANIGQEQVV